VRRRAIQGLGVDKPRIARNRGVVETSDLSAPSQPPVLRARRVDGQSSSSTSSRAMHSRQDQAVAYKIIKDGTTVIARASDCNNFFAIFSKSFSAEDSGFKRIFRRGETDQRGRACGEGSDPTRRTPAGAGLATRPASAGNRRRTVPGCRRPTTRASLVPVHSSRRPLPWQSVTKRSTPGAANRSREPSGQVTSSAST
jgi:hypothetical protein